LHSIGFRFNELVFGNIAPLMIEVGGRVDGLQFIHSDNRVISRLRNAYRRVVG
jgi:hypothetical protein